MSVDNRKDTAKTDPILNVLFNQAKILLPDNPHDTEFRIENIRKQEEF